MKFNCIELIDTPCKKWCGLNICKLEQNQKDMNPKKEARRLVDKYYLIDIPIKQSQQSALICVDEIIEVAVNMFHSGILNGNGVADYYRKVNQEILKIK